MPVMGRPRKELDWHLLDSLVALDAQLDYCAEKQLEKWGETSCKQTIKAAREVIERRIRERFDITFTEYKNKRLEPLRISLRKKQIEVAMKGNTVMLIFLGKNYLGQSDKVEQQIEHNVPEDKGSLILKVKEKLVEIEKKAEPINITPKQTVDVVEDQVVTYNQNTDPKENN